MRTRTRTRTKDERRGGPYAPTFLMRRGEARRAILSAMQIFKSGPRRWALEPKKALIPGSMTLNDPDHLVARPEGVRGRTTSSRRAAMVAKLGGPLSPFVYKQARRLIGCVFLSVEIELTLGRQ